MSRRQPSAYRRGFVLWAFLVGACLLVSWWQIKAPWQYLVIGSLNLTSFVLYGLDKFFALMHGWRVPEYILYFAAFAGGPVGALLGMYIFRHKISKVSFQFSLALIILLEILLIWSTIGIPMYE